jgi:hypothetical protein
MTGRQPEYPTAENVEKALRQAAATLEEERNINDPASPHAELLTTLVGHIEGSEGEADGLLFSDVEDGEPAWVTITDGTIAEYRLMCVQVPRHARLHELGLDTVAFGRAGCWPADGEPETAARARGAAAECAADAASALRGGDPDRGRDLLLAALRHLDDNTGRLRDLPGAAARHAAIMTDAVQPAAWYPSPAPALPGEGGDQYTDRLTGAAGDGHPYDHPRNRQCSIGYHQECSARVRLLPDIGMTLGMWIAAQRAASRPAGGACRCPCHTDVATLLDLPDPLDRAVNAAASKLAGLYSLPPVTGLRVMLMAAAAAGGTPRPELRTLRAALQDHYRSPQTLTFLTDIGNIYAAAVNGTLKPGEPS